MHAHIYMDYQNILRQYMYIYLITYILRASPIPFFMISGDHIKINWNYNYSTLGLRTHFFPSNYFTKKVFLKIVCMCKAFFYTVLNLIRSDHLTNICLYPIYFKAFVIFRKESRQSLYDTHKSSKCTTV